ncbi:MAG: hypothetical protein KAG34_02940 [Cocleimonas sp.]|nr:hypothetical protein [Cocleimonas sp.]
MINQTNNNFQALTKSINSLNKGQIGVDKPVFLDVSTLRNSESQEKASTTNLNGFQKNIEQQYSLTKEDSSELLSLLEQVLSEIMEDVITNTESSENKTPKTESSKLENTDKTTDNKSNEDTASDETHKGSCPYSG